MMLSYIFNFRLQIYIYTASGSVTGTSKITTGRQSFLACHFTNFSI